MKIEFGRKLALALMMAVAPAMAWAAGASEQLNQFVSQVNAAKGEFTQQRVGDQGASLSPRQSGVFSFRRPGKFKWAVTQPYEQLILSDGKQVYQYDPDLAQVTERGVDESVGASPAAILFGSGALEDVFTLEERGERDGLLWLRATPRTADAGFTYVDIGFQNGMPARLLVQDSFSQTTRIDLAAIEKNPSLPADEYVFKAPEGVDVVKMP